MKRDNIDEMHMVDTTFIHIALAFTFSTLSIGFILLDFAYFGFPEVTLVAAYALIAYALSAGI